VRTQPRIFIPGAGFVSVPPRFFQQRKNPLAEERLSPQEREWKESAWATTNRPLRTRPDWNARGVDVNKIGVLDLLGLDPRELTQGKVLDVCAGGGNALREARSWGLDYYAVDLLPILSFTRDDRIGGYRHDLVDAAKKFPGRVIAADASKTLPFADRTFDVVFSCTGMPKFTPTPEAYVNSILEMIRVADRKVAFTTTEMKGAIDHTYRRDVDFHFRLYDWIMQRLAPYGIVAERAAGQLANAIHLTVKDRDHAALEADREALIADAKNFVVKSQPAWSFPGMR
jgi:SAM-dependent methyltransferase